MSRTSETRSFLENGLIKQTALYQQHLDKVFCDIVIKIKDEKFYVHTCIIAASCQKLQELIEERKVHVDQQDHPGFEVEISEHLFSPKVFGFILSYMYLGVLDWSKVAPYLVNQVLDAANWCGFNQLIDDYMSYNQEDEQDNVTNSSTIIIVDNSDGFIDREECLSENDELNNGADEQFAVQFDFGDETALAEVTEELNSPLNEQIVSRRGVARRKASIGLKQKYKSLIPNYKEESDDQGEYYKKPRQITKKPRYSKNHGRVLLFKKEYSCENCNKKLASQKALTNHLRNQCPYRETIEEIPVSLSNEDIASQLLGDIGNEEMQEEGCTVLRSTKSLTVETGSYVRSYVKKNNSNSEKRGQNVVKFERKIKTAKLWICPQCPDYIFERKRDQIDHIRSVHGVIKRHICDRCGKSLDGRTALALHMRIHTGERPFVCPTCGRGFSERKTMEDHTRRHTGERPFLCTICGKDFTFRQSLYRHMKFHSGERPYQCQVCGKTFVLKQNLQEHVARHSKHTLSKCDQCNSQFANKDLLLRHQLEDHVIDSNTVEAHEVHQEMNVIDMSGVLTDPETNTTYEVTIDSRMLKSYE